MVALYIVMCLISIFSSVIGTLGSEGMITLDDVLAEMSSMRNDMDDKMSSMRSDMEEVSEMMNNRLNKLIRQVEDLRDIHLPSKTTSPTPPTLPSTTTTPTPSTLPPQTTTPTPPTLPPQPSACSSYTELSDAWRHIDYINRGDFPKNCDKTGSYTEYRKYTNLALSWYRFTGAAGTKLPTAPAPVGGHPGYGSNQVCGTHAVAWLKGDNPTIQDGIVTRDVCFEFSSSSCLSKTTVGVAACRDMHGDYFVYQLQPVPSCSYAYCAID